MMEKSYNGTLSLWERVAEGQVRVRRLCNGSHPNPLPEGEGEPLYDYQQISGFEIGSYYFAKLVKSCMEFLAYVSYAFGKRRLPFYHDERHGH